MDRRPTKQGKPVVRVRLDGRDKLPSQNPLNVKLKAAIEALESRPRREVTQADLDSYARVNKTERKANDAYGRVRGQHAHALQPRRGG